MSTGMEGSIPLAKVSQLLDHMVDHVREIGSAVNDQVKTSQLVAQGLEDVVTVLSGIQTSLVSVDEHLVELLAAKDGAG